MAAATLTDWDPMFSRYFAFSTLTALGYRTRVSLSNASDLLGARAEPVRLRVSFHGPDGRRLLAGRDCGMLEPGCYWTLPDVEAFAAEAGVDVKGIDGELLGIVHQTPLSHEHRRDIVSREVATWVGLGDDFVEYIHPATGATGGVFYQCPPLNDARLGRVWVTVCQSPKLLFDDRCEPFVLLLNISTDPAWRVTGTMGLTLFAATGEPIGRGAVTVPAFSSRLVALRAVLSAPGYEGNASLIGISTGAVLVPFTFVRDHHSGAMAIDHTMPPGNYHSAWADKRRREAWAADLLQRTEGGWR